MLLILLSLLFLSRRCKSRNRWSWKKDDTFDPVSCRAAILSNSTCCSIGGNLYAPSPLREPHNILYVTWSRVRWYMYLEALDRTWDKGGARYMYLETLERAWDTGGTKQQDNKLSRAVRVLSKVSSYIFYRTILYRFRCRRRFRIIREIWTGRIIAHFARLECKFALSNEFSHFKHIIS